MQHIDWIIVALLFAGLAWAAFSTKRYTRSVAGFLAAERCGGRYLIAVADEMSKLGVLTLVWYFEMNYDVGFTSIWWGLMEGPALIIMAISGWVIYRYRQTRAMTLAQFFEMRYSRRFRIFAGVVAYLAGIINFGIFPSVGARFFIHLWGLPANFTFGGFEAETYPFVMAALLGVSMAFLFAGGQIAVMVTDFLQGSICNIAFIVIILFLLVTYDWGRISETLLSAPAGKSMVDPFDLGNEEHFNVFYYVISVITVFYGARSWQGTQGYNCAAKSPHEAKMAFILSGWRFRVLMLIILVLPICVRTFLTHPDYATASAGVTEALNSIDSDALRNQARTPLAMAAMLPAGLLGLASAAMLGAFISTHDTYLHSWGAILVQDVIMPFRKRPLSQKQHLWLLRCSIFFVAVFIFAFSLLFRQTQYIAMFCALTGSVFVGGAGAAIIGGLYWKRGTTSAAWAAMITGMTTSLVALVLIQIIPERVSLTGQEISFIAITASVLVYVVVSLSSKRPPHNMDRLLHRGRYAIDDEMAIDSRRKKTWWEKLGFTREFTGRDRIVTYITLSWPLIWTIIFLVGSAYCVMKKVSGESWLAYWRGWTWFILACGVIITIWFTIGGVGDMRYLYRKLKTQQLDENDDGRVASTSDGSTAVDRVE